MDAHGYPINSAEYLRMLRESAAQITAESAQETISATAQAKPQKRAFTEHTWDLQTDPHYAYLRGWEDKKKRAAEWSAPSSI